MTIVLTIIGIAVCIVAIYIALGTVICWLLSSAGDEKMSLNGVTLRFIFTWPFFLLRSKAI